MTVANSNEKDASAPNGVGFHGHAALNSSDALKLRYGKLRVQHKLLNFFLLNSLFSKAQFKREIRNGASCFL